MNINSTICENLHEYKNIEDIVQKEVSRLNIAGSYIQTVPSIIISLLLGNFKSITSSQGIKKNGVKNNWKNFEFPALLSFEWGNLEQENLK